MADSDPISEATPNKRRKLQHSQVEWESEDEYGEELTAKDVVGFEVTQPTLPLPENKGHGRLQHSKDQSTAKTVASQGRLPSSAYAMEATQTLPDQAHVTQPTQLLSSQGTTTQAPDVQVPRSSPAQSPQRPSSIRKAPFTKPPGRGGLLARSIGPAGTSFKPPPGIQSQAQPETITLDDSDDEPDPPISHSDDDETQGLTSNIKPTRFTSGGRGLNSTPNRSSTSNVISETPVRNATPTRSIAGVGSASTATTTFGSLMASFAHQPTQSARPARPSDDMAHAYGGQVRRPKTQPNVPQNGPPRVHAATTPVRYKTLNDIEDPAQRNSIVGIMKILGNRHSYDKMHAALVKCHGNSNDAMELLVAEQETPKHNDDADELSSLTPAAKRGQAVRTSQPHKEFSEATRRNAKQEVKAPQRSILEKYTATQQARKASQATLPPKSSQAEDSEEDVQPRKGRLLNGRRAGGRSLSPALSPPPNGRRKITNRNVITIDDDDDDDGDDDDDDEGDSRQGESAAASVDAENETESFDSRLLKFFNECTVRELADLCAQPEDVVQYVLDQRPFSDLDVVRLISNVTETKSGRKSKTRPIGDKIVDISTEMMRGYEAVDDLVQECEKIARPIQQALKGWGVGDANDGELHLMNLDEAHDSGIGTPASSCSGEPGSKGVNPSARSKFLGQPENMGDFTMKDYQLVGLNWLNLLWTKKISCILADDMGLGKTCQVIAFLAHLQLQEVDGVHLVVVPGSTLENWLREFARFAPSLKVFPYYGGQKERPELREQIEADFSSLDVIVTTYDMASKPEDNKFLRRLGPAVCVFDEAHGLRNPNSDRYSQLMRIPSDFRILLTGTPLQNNLQELIAILAFIMPQLFQGKREELDFIFKHKATTKDSDHAALLSADRIARARTMMTPFILRRKKQQVLDLPAKHSRVEWCDMTATQSAYYMELVTEAQRLFSESAKGTTKAKAAKASSNILMALRKAAIQPLLSRYIYNEDKINKIVAELAKHEEFGGNPREKIKQYLIGEGPQGLKGGDYALHVFCSERDYLRKYALKKEQWMDSGKVQKFKELVSAYHRNGDRLLVFSQFTTMMDILEAVLETLNIKFMRLDGSTRMDTRQDMIDQFAADESITVFMLSTKAGGAGINLACANKVIIFDSGFNPQDDIQAENRAHRVGQTREVEVVRLVTRGTIEEQIHTLGESKLALDDRVAGEGATAAEDKQTEKDGEQMVEKLFKESVLQQEKEAKKEPKKDIKDAFKAGLENAGVRVASKQAQY